MEEDTEAISRLLKTGSVEEITDFLLLLQQEFIRQGAQIEFSDAPGRWKPWKSATFQGLTLTWNPSTQRLRVSLASTAPKLTQDDCVEAKLGDLAEIFDRDVKRMGTFHAQYRYWSSALIFLGAKAWATILCVLVRQA